MKNVCPLESQQAFAGLSMECEEGHGRQNELMVEGAVSPLHSGFQHCSFESWLPLDHHINLEHVTAKHKEWSSR